MKARNITVFILLAMFVGIMATGCGSGPVQAVKGFMEAAMEGNMAGAVEYLPEEDRYSFDNLAALSAMTNAQKMVENSPEAKKKMKELTTTMKKACSYNLVSEEGSNATVHMTMDLGPFIEELLGKQFASMMPKDQMKTTTEFVLENRDGIWLIVDQFPVM